MTYMGTNSFAFNKKLQGEAKPARCRSFFAKHEMCRGSCYLDGFKIALNWFEACWRSLKGALSLVHARQ